MVWVLGVERQKCRGLATFWQVAGVALPPRTLDLPTPDEMFARLMPGALRSFVLSQRPAVPPPRFSGTRLFPRPLLGQLVPPASVSAEGCSVSVSTGGMSAF
jgi:hypothetical protein